MRSNRPSRWLAPLALLAAVAAVLVVFNASTKDEKGGGSKATTQGTGEARGGRTSTGDRTETGPRTTTTRERRRYTVRPGDTLASIAEKTGVSVEEIQELNPDVDPNSLTVGETIKLAE
jgi:teichoic acid transport system ATP-binding protein